MVHFPKAVAEIEEAPAIQMGVERSQELRQTFDDAKQDGDEIIVHGFQGGAGV
jgi:hypothetical protein